MTKTAKAVGYIPLPDDFAATEDQKKAITHLVNTRIPVEIDMVWKTDKRPMHAIMMVAPPWPGMVHFADMVPAMLDCEPGNIVMGLTRDGEPFHRKFTGDTPHWGFSVNTGFGKSTMFCVTGAQILRQEEESALICIDPKKVSFDPLVGIPGVTVYNDFRNVQAMWGGIEDHLNILWDRMDKLAADPTLTFPSQVLLLDELNMFAMLTEAAWTEEKEANGGKGPAMAPVWKKLAMALYAGRQFACYVVVMAQRVDDKTTGRLGLQTLLNLKAMAGFGPQDWKRFVGTYPIPRSSSQVGRWIYTDGQNRTWVQNTHTDIKDGLEVRNYAMANRSGLITPEPALRGPVPVPGSDTAWVTGLEAGAAHLGLKTATFVKRRQREKARGNPIPGEWQDGGQPVWRAVDLNEWASEKARV